MYEHIAVCIQTVSVTSSWGRTIFYVDVKVETHPNPIYLCTKNDFEQRIPSSWKETAHFFAQSQEIGDGQLIYVQGGLYWVEVSSP